MSKKLLLASLFLCLTGLVFSSEVFALPTGQLSTINGTAVASLPTISGAIQISGTANIVATASDNGGSPIEFVKLYVDTTAPVGLIGSVALPGPYAFSWNSTSVSNGAHVLILLVQTGAGTTNVQNVAVYVNNGGGSGGSITGTINYYDYPKIQGPLYVFASTVNVITAQASKVPFFNYDPYLYDFNYAVANLANGSYYAFAFIDKNGNAAYDADEPSGTWGSVLVVAGAPLPNIGMTLSNPAGLSYLNVTDPKEGKSVYFEDTLWTSAEAYSGNSISKVEVYIDDVLQNTFNNDWSNSPFWVYWDWSPANATIGTHKVDFKSYTYNNNTPLNTVTRNINVTSTRPKKIYGNANYSGQEPGKVIVGAYLSKTGAPSRTTTLDYPGYFELEVPEGQYYVRAFKDKNDNHAFDDGTDPKSAFAGPYTLSATVNEVYGVYMDIYGATETVKGKIEGNVDYTSTFKLQGPLTISLFKGTDPLMVFEGNPLQSKIIYGPYYPSWFSFDNLDAGHYFIVAYVDANNINPSSPQYDVMDPSGIYGGSGLTSVSTNTGLDLAAGENKWLPQNLNIINPGEVAPVEGGGTLPTGTNSISGNIAYPDGQVGTSRIVVKAYDLYNQYQEYKTEIYGTGFYQISNMPNITNCVVEAFVDYNWDFMGNISEPKAKLAAFNLSSSVTGKDLSLAKQEVVKTTMTVTVRVKVRDSNDQAISGAMVRMFDTGGFDDWMPENDIFKSSTTSSSNYSGTVGQQYNASFANATVYQSQDGAWYYYEFKVSKDGYKMVDDRGNRMDSKRESFQNWDAGQTRYVDITLSPKPQITMANLVVTPTNKTITPNYDGTDDAAKFKFNYSVNTQQMDWSNGAQAKLVVDTNGDGQFVPMDWSIFVYIDGKEFIKWNAQTNQPDKSIFVDFMNPDYTKLKGPLTWEERDRYSANFDATMDWWIDGWSLLFDGSKYYQDVEMLWEGKDNRWQTVKNGTYAWKLMLDEPGQFDAADGLIASSSGTITVQTPSIKGVVQDANGTALEGVRVSAGGPQAWGESFSDASGNFEVSGLRVSGANDYYFLEASKKGYVRTEMPNLQIPEAGTLTLTDPIKLSGGIKVSGTITIPNPPTRGALRDNMGNQLYDLWGRIEAWRTDGPGWYSADVQVALPSTAGQTSLDTTYEIYLEPGEFEMQLTMSGYVSKSIPLTIAQDAITQNITMTKSAGLSGTLKLPVSTQEQVTALLDDAKKKGFWGGIWINLNAESRDRKSHSWSGVNFDSYELQNSTTFAKSFLFDSLVPGTTYTIRIESQGLFALRTFDVVMPLTGSKSAGEVALSFGAKLKGKITLKDNVASKIDSIKYGGFMNTAFLPAENIASGKIFPIWVDVRNTQTFSTHGFELWVSSTTFPAEYEFEIKGLTSGWHEVEINGIRGVDIAPALESRGVLVSTNTHTSTAAVLPDITVTNPTGILKGTITNSSGKTVDWSKVAVVYATVDDEGGDPVAANVTASADGLTGEFTLTNLMTAELILWGTEYRVKPYAEDENNVKSDMFGNNSGKVSTFLKLANAQSGGATTYFTADLEPASTIYIRITGSAATVADIIAKTTTYVSSQYGMRPALAKFQPITLRKLAEKMEKSKKGDKEEFAGKEEEKYSGPDKREIALSGEFVPELTSGTTVVFKLCGLAKGIYFVYPLVNYRMYYGQELGLQGWPVQKYVEYAYSSSPMEKYVVLGEDESKNADFSLGNGVTVNGSVTRPSGNYTAAQTVSVSLRDPVTNDIRYSSLITYSTTTRTNTQTFTFNKVSAGRYILIVRSADYKVYTKSLEISEVSGTVTLAAVKLAKGATLTGKIVNADGQGISEGIFVQCEAIPYVEGSYMDSNMPSVTISSASATKGTFTFPNLPGGTYQVKASITADSKVNLVTKVKAGIVVPDSETTVDISNLTLKNATYIKGLVKNTEGNGLANIRVVTYPQDSQRRENMFLTTKTDKDGVFIIKGIDSSVNNWEVKVNVRDDDPTKKIEKTVQYGSALRIVDISTIKDIGTVTLAIADATVIGAVATPNNTQLTLPFPIEGVADDDYPAALVILQSRDDLASGDPLSGIKVITSGDGTFEIDGIVKGQYTIKVFAKHFATYQSTRVVVTGTNDFGTITLETGATVTGSIRTQTGGKISKSDASIVVAATRDFKKVVFGAITANPATLELDSYEIVGLEPGVNYHIVLVEPMSGKVYVDRKSTAAANNADYITHPIVYRKLAPSFEAKVFKSALPGYIIKGEMTVAGQTIKFKGIFDDYDVNLSAIDPNTTYDVYFVLGFISQPVMEESVAQIVSTVTASGVFVPMQLADSRKALSCAYIPAGNDATLGSFELRFKGRNAEGLTGNDLYRFYLGEDGRSEKIVNPMVGGNLSLGEGDGTGIDLPAGVEFEGADNDVAISSGVKAQVIKVLDETVTVATIGRQFGPKKYSPQAFSTKLASRASYPSGSTLMSDIYDLQVKLVAGPLATIASNSSVGVKIKLSTAALNVANTDDLGLYHFDSAANAWTKETGAATIDWTNFLLSMNVGHFSKFAVFYVPGSAGAPAAGTAAADLSAFVLYPNPYKANSADYSTAGELIYFDKLTAKADIKIYNIAGEKVYEASKNDTTDRYTWDMKNKDAKKLASGVYIYYITNPDNSAHKAVGKFSIIK